MIKVLIVEDSPTVREFLVHVLGSDPALEIVGTARDGEEAIKAVASQRPDVVTMDITMPRMDGLEATRRIMESQPVPIIIVSAQFPTTEAAASFRAVDAGALAVVPRPAGLGHSEHQKSVAHLLRTVKLMAGVKVVRRWPARHPPVDAKPAEPAADFKPAGPIRILAFGGSTGAPAALRTILCALPKGLRVPVLVVQHIAAGFVDGFAQWLAQSCAMPVKVAADGEELVPGTVYVAPDQLHLAVKAPHHASLTNAPLEHGSRPSVSVCFRSVAEVYGSGAIAVLLSGMGKDGAEALGLLKQRGALTIAQSAESSVVHGMPGEAIKLGAARWVLGPEAVAPALADLIIRR